MRSAAYIETIEFIEFIAFIEYKRISNGINAINVINGFNTFNGINDPNDSARKRARCKCSRPFPIAAKRLRFDFFYMLSSVREIRSFWPVRCISTK